MKKIIALFALFAFVALMPKVFAYQLSADAYTQRIPKGTKLNLVMAEPLSTSEMQAGDMFSARLTKDIKMNGKTILPSGSLVRGTVEKYKPTARLSRSALLYLTFDHVVTPQGRQLPISAAICSNFDILEDGAISGGGNYWNELKRNAQKSGKIISNTTKWGITSGEELFTGGRFLVTPFAAIGGTIGGGAYLIGDSVIDLFRKGHDVVIDQGIVFDVILLEPLDVPIS